MALSSDDEDAPESFSLVDSKRTVKRQSANLRNFQASEKEKKRVRNRERDKRLKEQAGSAKRRLRDAETRMEEAMRDAEEEEVEEGTDPGNHRERKSDGDDRDDGAGDDATGNGEGELEMVDDDEDNDEPKTNPAYLPDHIFVSAFSKPPDTRRSDPGPSGPSLPRKKDSKKHTRSTNTSKDIVIGSRVVRTLGDPAKKFPSAAATIPRPKVRNFVDRSLGLKGNGPKSKSWTRKPAHIGVLKTSGPPANFVRTR